MITFILPCWYNVIAIVWTWSITKAHVVKSQSSAWCYWKLGEHLSGRTILEEVRSLGEVDNGTLVSSVFISRLVWGKQVLNTLIPSLHKKQWSHIHMELNSWKLRQNKSFSFEVGYLSFYRNEKLTNMVWWLILMCEFHSKISKVFSWLSLCESWRHAWFCIL